MDRDGGDIGGGDGDGDGEDWDGDGEEQEWPEVHPNIVRLYDVIWYQSGQPSSPVANNFMLLLFDFCQWDLASYIEKRAGPTGFSKAHIQVCTSSTCTDYSSLLL